MTTLVTEAIVLHAFDYLETSRILRLMTRESGVESVLARAARNSRKRFGSSLDLFAQGTAEIQIRPGRELQSLLSFDVSRGRAGLATDVGRFTAGAMIAELALKTSSDESAPALFDAVESALDRVAASSPDATITEALAGAWQIIAALGFAPALDVCANCHSDLDPGTRVAFSHAAGGALCPKCGGGTVASRTLPPEARSTLRGWLEGVGSEVLAEADARAHQRLLREFYREHLGPEKDLKAFKVWESAEWTRP
jgi:DNA repair protein RecO (recombination protein O)